MNGASGPVDVTVDEVTKRQRLASLLRTAALVEHAVMCQYLFAAATLKNRFDEGGVSWADLERMRTWRGSLLLVARGEMEHLGLVLNILTAIGEGAVLRRPNFPFEAGFDGVTEVLSLEPFSVETMHRFCMIEMPEKLEKGSEGWNLLSRGDPGFAPARFDFIARLYDAIEQLLRELPEAMLFIGPPDAQFETSEIFPGAVRGISLAGAPAYNISLRAVVNRETALAALDQIQDEGEGSKRDGTNSDNASESHFEIFLEIFKSIATSDGVFHPARPSIANPRLDGSGPSVVTHAVTRRVMQLFDLCYHTLILALTRYWAHTDESDDDLKALQAASFFPMMTTVIRPLAECLTQLPAYADGSSATAGPSFTLPDTIGFLPHRDAAFGLLDQQYSAMVQIADELSTLANGPSCPPELKSMADRLTAVHATLWRSQVNLRQNTGMEPRNA